MDHFVRAHPLPVFGPVGTAAVLRATEAMLGPDIGYRLAHHGDLQWPPVATVTEVDHGVVFEEGSVRASRPPPPIMRLSGRLSASVSKRDRGRW